MPKSQSPQTLELRLSLSARVSEGLPCGSRTHLDRQPRVGSAPFWVILIVAILWVSSLGIDSTWSGDLGLWSRVLLLVFAAPGLREWMRKDWPIFPGATSPFKAGPSVDKLVVITWIRHERPDLCGSGGVCKVPTVQALPATPKLRSLLGGRKRRALLAIALLILLGMLAVLGCLHPLFAR